MCKKNVMIGELLVVVLLLLGGAVAHAGSDVFSLNFYYKPWPWPDTDTHNITLEDGNQSAGFDDWLTDGWHDIEVPWAPPGPQDPVPITSKEGATATFTLINARNGGSYSWDQVRTTLLGDGNGDLMDGHANGTEDEDAGRVAIIEMTVSDIPFTNYDVIIYMGSQSAQFGDGTAKIVFNGVEQDFTLTSGAFDGTFTEIVDAGTPGNYILYEGLKDSSFTVVVRGNGFNHIGPCGFQIRQASPELAANPDPAEEATDVSRDVVLSWTPGELTAVVNGHIVYLSENFDNVNDGVGVGGIIQSATSYDPERLKFGTTYYWRVDEVAAPPASTVYPGEVWSFTTELFAYPIENVIATASSSNVGEGAENTVNGSGVDANDLHSTDPQAMWISEAGDPGSASIQYEFDKPCKLHEMLVWNYNGNSILTLYGLKEVTIEYSTDGTNWSQLENVPEFVQAIGEEGYAANTTIAFNGAAAKYVKITANSNWGGGGFFNQYGLSEVRFFGIPVHATEPSPDSGATDVDVDVVLGWKAGRDAASHDVYISTDPDALTLAGPVTEPAFDTASLDLALGQTYHWRVDEVNDAETTTSWQGDIWSFSTPEFLVVDDFESYNDLNPDDPESNRIFLMWIGGDDDPANGSQVGNDTFPFAEQFFVHGGNQAMPFFYSNTGGATYSEAERTFADPQDWTKAGIQTLVLYLRADSLSDALDTTSSLTTDGSANWFSQVANSYDDEDAAQSGDISDNQESLMRTTVSGAGTASFYWTVSSEADYDFLEFYIDDSLQDDRISGTVDWQQMTYTITAPGLHTLEWRYMKDEGASGGEDTGWVDKFEWDGGGQPALIPGNTGQLYLKVNGVKLDYPGNVADIEWMQWKIDLADLASLGVDLQAVRTLAIGIAGDDASGTLYFDDFLLEPAVQAAHVSLIEDFDSLAVGSNMQDVDGWEGWFGDLNAGARVTDAVAYSGTNSLEIVGNRDDLVPNWPQQTTGKWVLSVMQYCPSNTQATGLVYFGPLTEYDGATQTVSWISEFMANFETGKAYCSGDDTIQVDLVYDDWAELRLEVDLDAQEADFYYDNVFLSTQPAPSIAGVDIWPDEFIVGVYFDDFRFEPVVQEPITITVPNGDFEEIYKPGSDTITADLGDGWTQGLGLDTPMDDGTATYSDGTTGDVVDIPGWIGADPQGWIDNGGTYDRDTSFPNRQGSVARQSDTPDGLYYYLSNGGGWGNAAGGLIVSDAPLATVEDGLTYTLSMLANGGATPVVLELLADGVALTPSSSEDPELSDDWQEFSRTYDAGSLAGNIGESLTIRVGVGRGASGGQSHLDAVSLSYAP